MRPSVLSFGVAVLLAALAPQSFAQQHPHHVPAIAESTAPAHRYATDATLRQEMREIHGEVLALGHYQHDHITPELASDLAGRIVGHVNTIIAHCELPPDADAALHLIIVPLIQNATVLKADPDRRDVIPAMRQSLEQYARQFDDPGFADLRKQ